MNEEFENHNIPQDENDDFFGNVEFPPRIDDDTAIDYEEPKPKKGLRIFARCTAALLAICLVSFSAIQVYRYWPQEDPTPNKPTNTDVNNDAENNNPTTGSSVEYTAIFETEDPDTAALATESIAEKVSPSIVTVVCQIQSTSSGFGGQSQTSTATGSGIIISSDGYVVTNYHVIEGSVSVEVYLNDHNKYVAAIVGGDALSDLAVLKLDATDLPAAEFGNSDNLKIGEKAVAIGNPLGIEFAGTVTQGIISGLDREIEVGGVAMTLIQTDATINPGNSGGALVNKYGQVIGVTSSKISIDYAEGIAFAIPSNDAVKVVNDLINLGYVAGRPYIGLS